MASARASTLPDTTGRRNATGQAPGGSELRFILVLVVATAIGPMAMQIFLPALPIIQSGFGVSAAAAQLAFSLSAFAMAVATLFYGPVSDRFGRRPTMIGGLLVFLFGSYLCVVAGSITTLVLGRVVQAAGGCVGMVLSRAVIRDVYDRDRSATMIAYVTMAMVVAPTVSPAIGGILTEAVSWRAVFLFGGLLGLLALIAVCLDMRETAPAIGRAANLGDMLRGFSVLLRSRLFLGYAGHAAFSIAVFFGFLAAAPYVMITVFGRPPSEYGLYFIATSAAFMGGNFVAARLTRRVGLDRMVVAGSVGSLLASAAALLLALAGFWNPLALFIPMSLGAFAQGMAIPNTQAAVVSVAPHLAGSASGLAGFAQMTIAAIAAQIIGSIQDGTPYPMTIGMTLCATLALLSALGALVARRREV
jgi:MFS transporter, DHA1 family, multidrug resistance protein